MTLSSFLNLFVRLTFLLLTILAIRDLWRHQDRTRLGIAAMFGSLALAILAGFLQPQNGTAQRLVQGLVLLGIASHPYLLLRLVSIFRPVSPVAHWISLGGIALSWLLVLFNVLGISSPLLLVIIAYFAYVEGYAAVSLIRGARNSGGVTRRRLLLIAAGTIMLTAALLIPRITNTVASLSTLGQPILLVLASAAAVTYYLGFATPRWLQRAWQMAELDRFLRQAAGRLIDRTAVKTLEDVCRAATRAIGAVTSVALMGEQADDTLPVAAANGSRLSLNSLSVASHGAAARAWRSGEPALAAKPEEYGLVEAQQIKEKTGAHALLSVPIETSVHTPGLLLVFLYGRPLFADDDLDLLQLYAEHTVITLDNIRLLADQQELVEKLVQNEAELEEQVAERTAELSRANERLKQEAAERRRLNEELEQRVRARTVQLEVANKELESFAYSVSHDLRAPLRAIDGFSQALLEDCADQIDEQGQMYLGRVRANTQRMGELIDALLLLSRLSRAEMVMEAVDLSALAKSVVAELRQEDEARQIQMSIEAGLVVEGDARLLRVVLENLLGNAWKFTSKRSEACIEFGAVDGEEHDVYYVRDNGVGFDMAYADKLFGAFQRLHPMNEFSGTGIGLATVQRVIHRHHGRVWAEAAPDEGATFFFTVANHGEKDGE